MMLHNFGHEKGSLLNVLDCMTEDAAHFLNLSDRDSHRVAERCHELISGGGRKKHRKKYTQRPGGSSDTYEAGAEPIFVADTGGSSDTNECDWEAIFAADTGGLG